METSQDGRGGHCEALHSEAIGTVGGGADFTGDLACTLKRFPDKLKDVRFACRLFSFNKRAMQGGIG